MYVFIVHTFNRVIGTTKISAIIRVKSNGYVSVLRQETFNNIYTCVHRQTVHDIEVYSAASQTSKYNRPDLARFRTDPNGNKEGAIVINTSLSEGRLKNGDPRGRMITQKLRRCTSMFFNANYTSL